MSTIQISIPEPCHENWQNMTPTDQGRYCNACAKVVVDFSMMSDAEVLNYFSALRDEKVCGRAMPAQLNRAISMPKEPKKRLFWYWNYIVMFFMFFSKSNYLKAQTKGEVVTVPIKQPCTKTVGMMIPIRQVKQVDHILTGQITDSKGAPIPFASIMIRNSKHGVSADEKGAFKITVLSGDYLKISAAGYQSKDIQVTEKTFLNVTLENSPVPLGGAVVVTAMGGIRRHTAQLEKTITDTAKVNNEKTMDSTKQLTGKNSGLQITMCNKDTNNHDTNFRVGRMRSTPKEKPALLVVDNVLHPISYISTLKPNDIEAVTVMKSATAIALYGADASNGVIIITTKKKQADDKNKKTKDSLVKAVITKIADKINYIANINIIKIYPDPVPRGNAFFIALKFQQTGPLDIQIADITGRVVLKKRVNTVSKDHLEKMEAENNWPAGEYFMSVFNADGVQAGKLISKMRFVVL